jgi:hypothetical protein
MLMLSSLGIFMVRFTKGIDFLSYNYYANFLAGNKWPGRVLETNLSIKVVCRFTETEIWNVILDCHY